MNKILILVLVAALVLGGWLFYRQLKTGTAFGDGSVVSKDLASTDKSGMDSGTTTDLDGNQPIGEAHPTPSRSDAPGTINTEPIAGATTTNQPGSGQYAPTAANGTQGSTLLGPSTPPPATDTIAPNPPNGEVFTGTGKYQWYRQGNITWRVDSGNGSYCIAFATMEEWQKPIVYNNGCGSGRG